MNRMINFFSQVNEWIGKAVSWLTLGLVVLTCGDVLFRYSFSKTQAWVMELEWHLFALIFLFGAGYALKHDRHVRVDLFYSRFSEKNKALVDFVGTLILLVPWCIMLIWFSWDYAQTSWMIREGSPDPGGLPARYLIKFAIPLGIGLLLLQAFSKLLTSWQSLRAKDQN
jgi:TRAP-type mannitol/chloroaromatic compound transport system permease small subunit